MTPRGASRRRPVVGAVIAALTTVILGATATLAVSGCAPPTASSGMGTDCASAAPDELWAPPEGAESDPHWATLLDNPLYSIPVPDLGGCPAPRTVASMPELEEEVRAQIACVQDAWRPVLEANGLDATEIPVTIYRGDSVTTPCGEISCPAVYCPSDGGGIYIGEGSLESATWFVLGVKGVVNHEYAHHLQFLAGVLDAQHSIGAVSDSVRRIELQATCLGYAMIAHDDSVPGSSLDTEADLLMGSVIGDDLHGSPGSVAYWGSRGLDAGTLADCNTWVAEAGAVS